MSMSEKVYLEPRATFDAMIIDEKDAVIYDLSALIAHWTKELGSTERAHEWFTYNVLGAYVGKQRPIYRSGGCDIQ